MELIIFLILLVQVGTMIMSYHQSIINRNALDIFNAQDEINKHVLDILKRTNARIIKLTDLVLEKDQKKGKK